MPPKAEPKISVSEAVLIGLFFAILDTIDLIPIAGDLTDVAAAPLVLYYFMKNINGTMFIISWFLDLIPVVQEIPTRSIVWWGTVIFERVAPAKLEQVTEEAGEFGEGGGELEGGEGLEAGASKGVEASENAGQEVSSAEEVQGEVGAETEGVEGAEAKGQEAGGETEAQEEEGGETENSEGEEGGEDISETESEENPIDMEKKKLLEGSGDDALSVEPDDDEESEDEEEIPNPVGKTTGIDSSKKWQENQRNAKPIDQPTSVYDIKPKKKAA